MGTQKYKPQRAQKNNSKVGIKNLTTENTDRKT